MNTEIETLSRQIRSLLDRVAEAVQGLNEAQLNWRPPIAGANSAYVIAAHTLGNARAWVLGIACGQHVDRDRPARVPRVRPRRRRPHRRRQSACRRKSKPRSPSWRPPTWTGASCRLPKYWGEGEPYEISVREALLHVVEHAALHLGQLQITRDLALEERLTCASSRCTAPATTSSSSKRRATSATGRDSPSPSATATSASAPTASCSSFRPTSAAVRMRVINPDGSEPEMCGNGIRCLAKYAVERGLVEPQDGRFDVETARRRAHPPGRAHGATPSRACASAWACPASRRRRYRCS